jgi:hypothetical protein
MNWDPYPSWLKLCGLIQRVDRVYAVQFSPNGRYLAVGL